MASTHDLTISLELAAGEIKTGLHVERCEGREAISEPYAHRVVFRSGSAIALEAVLGEPATLKLVSEAGELRVNGIVTQFSQRDGLGEQGHLYEATIAPRLKLLDLSHQNQVYGSASSVSVKDIIATELKGGDARPQVDYELNLSASYRQRDFIVQYNESDLNFLSRWCEANGIFYFFRQGEAAETAVFGDDNVAFPSSEAPVLAYRHGHGLLVSSTASVTSFGFSARAVTRQMALRDYNPDSPALPLRAEHAVPDGKIGSVVEYGQYFLTDDEGAHFARVRAQEIACRRQVFHGVSNAPQLRPGLFFDLEGHPSLDDRYLVIAVTHEAATPAPAGFGEAEGAAGKPYSNRFEAIRFSVPFRPERRAPRPVAAGLFTAFIDGEIDGERAQIDSGGRYKVRFRYDEAGNEAGRASEYIRKAEPYAGPADTGMHFPLLKGTEVILACLNGDIDRPIIVGAVPNPLTPNVVASRNQTINRLRSPAGTLFEMSDGPG